MPDARRTAAGTALMAERMAHIRPFHVMRLLGRARELEAAGRFIVHLEVGEPDFPAPEPVVRAARRALDAGSGRYTPAAGLPELREAIGAHYRRTFGVELDPRRILITPGASGALQLVMSVLIDPGRDVLMADPGYPCNRHFVRVAGGTPLGIAVDGSTCYQLDARAIDAHWTDATRAVMVATPSNPTGTTIPRSELRAIQDLVDRRGGALVVDEIYQGLVYGTAPTSVLENGDSAFVVNSFSKFFGMTGWRLGWVVAPPGYEEALERLAQNLFLCAPTLSQHAALAAFSAETLEILEERRRAFEARRDLLLAGLSELGFRFACRPQGAFYLYGECSGLTDDSYRLAEALLEQAGVAVTPGLDFGDYAAERHLRFAYTTSSERIEEGIARIGRFLSSAGRDR